MSYTSSDISILAVIPCDLGRILRVHSGHPEKYVQCYVSGELVAWQKPVEGVVEFVLAGPADEDVVFLLAVDEENAAANLWDEAFSVDPGRGNRIMVRSPQETIGFGPEDRWRVYVGEAGEAEATVLAHDQEFFPGARRSCGWGKVWGQGGWGFSGEDCIGWGHNWGYGQWGFDCDMLTWVSDPLSSGSYPVKVVVEDAQGNESAASETQTTVATFPRPASQLAVSSYVKATDTLTLTFEPSPDASG